MPGQTIKKHIACDNGISFGVKRNIIWHVLLEHCNICCVSLGRKHWPRAMVAHVPEVLVRMPSPPDLDSHGNHSNQSRGESGGGELVATGELERNKEGNVTSLFCRLNHKPRSWPFISRREWTHQPRPLSLTLYCVGQCLTFNAAKGEQRGELGHAQRQTDNKCSLH